MDLSIYASSVVKALSVLTIAGQIIFVGLVILLFIEMTRGTATRTGTWVARHGLSLMLTVALFATLGSLYFSEIAGWTPCKLCWFQRIFMYPQVLLLGLAIWKRDTRIAPYILLLSIVGAAFAGLHYSEQLQAALYPAEFDPLQPCDESGVSCARRIVFTFGYITIPMMALTSFALNAIGSIFMMRRARSQGETKSAI